MFQRKRETHCSSLVNYVFKSTKTSFCSFWRLAFTFFSVSHSAMVSIIFSYLNSAVMLASAASNNQQKLKYLYSLLPDSGKLFLLPYISLGLCAGNSGYSSCAIVVPPRLIRCCWSDSGWRPLNCLLLLKPLASFLLW